jgi:hypothetical protein
VQDEVRPVLLHGGDVLDQATEAQFAHRGALPGLVVGETAGCEAQEVPPGGEHREQVGALALDVWRLSLTAGIRVACDRVARRHGFRPFSVRVRIPFSGLRPRYEP